MLSNLAHLTFPSFVLYCPCTGICALLLAPRPFLLGSSLPISGPHFSSCHSFFIFSTGLFCILVASLVSARLFADLLKIVFASAAPTRTQKLVRFALLSILSKFVTDYGVSHSWEDGYLCVPLSPSSQLDGQASGERQSGLVPFLSFLRCRATTLDQLFGI